MQGSAATGMTRTEALRKRRSGSAAEPEPEAASSHIANVVKSLDVYPKTLDDFKERTGSGAAVSVVSLSIIFLLVISEFYAYLTPTTTDHLYVDTSRGERIRVNLNLTFPNMPCAGMSLVAMDVAGAAAAAAAGGRRLRDGGVSLRRLSPPLQASSRSTW